MQEGREPVGTVVALTTSDADLAAETLRDWLTEPASRAPWVLVVTGAGAAEEAGRLERLVTSGDRSPDRTVTSPTAALSSCLPDAVEALGSDWVVLVAGNAVPLTGWSQALLSSVEDASDEVGLLQPLVVQQDGTVASAGMHVEQSTGAATATGTGGSAGPLLGGGDLLASGPRSPVVAARREDLRRLAPWQADGDGGLGEAALAAALAAAGRPWTRVSVGSRIMGRAQKSVGYPGSRVASDTVWLDSRPVDPERSRLAEPSVGVPEVRLHWCIGTSAPHGLKGQRWGDTAFAAGLAHALRGLGHDVSVDTGGRWSASSRRTGDVVLSLRGLHRHERVDGAVNVLWVISHPDLVTREEVADHDLVYAASPAWAERRSREWGVEIRPLLQCTDPDVFRDPPAPDRPHTTVFVGTAVNGRRRPVVDEVLAAGRPVDVVGRGWDGVDGAVTVLGEYATSPQVARLYGSSRVVLADHWEDMAREGFVANRVFDALACGAAVVCDDVAGVVDLAPELVHRLDGDPAAVVRAAAEVGDDVRARVAAAVRADHGFAARARTLSEDVWTSLARARTGRVEAVEVR